MSEQTIRSALSKFNTALISVPVDWVANLKAITQNNGDYQLVFTVGFPCDSIIEQVEQEIEHEIAAALGEKFMGTVSVAIQPFVMDADQLRRTDGIPGVKHVIAVASGKGGVGKSTSAVNLAMALKMEGATVGLLDADIYGPSLQMMLGVAPGTTPEITSDRRWKPIEAHGVQVMSMGFLITERTPMLWRGPMVSGALLQLLNNTLWDDIDYLIVDLPPGTGDIQLTCVQKIPMTGGLIVTTPQDIALLDAKKGVEMFNKVGVPILGFLENMAMHICSQCGHQEHIFGDGGGQRMAELYHAPLLGAMPLDIHIREQGDSGVPIVVSDAEGSFATQYRLVARSMIASLATQLQSLHLPEIEIVAD